MKKNSLLKISLLSTNTINNNMNYSLSEFLIILLT